MMREHGAELVTLSLKQKLQALINNKLRSLQRNELFQKTSDYLYVRVPETKIWTGQLLSIPLISTGHKHF